MKSLWNKLHQVGDALHLSDLPNWLYILLILIFLLRIPSFFEPYYYGDEMIYMSLGQGVRQGLTLYKDLHDNKPPLLYILASLSGSLFWFKAMLMTVNIGSIIVFWNLAKYFFEKNKQTIIVATCLFGTITTMPLLEGNTINSELFMLFTTICAFVILLSKKLGFKNIYFAGLLLGLSILFKVPSIFDVPVVILFWFLTTKHTNWLNVVKNTFYLIIGVITPIALTFVWYWYWGALNDYLVAAFLQNFGYLSSWRASNTPKIPFLVKNGPLLVRFSVVAIGTLILFWQRKNLSKKFIFLSLWTLFSLFAVTLSERPYPHYLIQSTPVIAFFLSMLLTEKNFEQSLVIIPLSLILFVPNYYKFWHYSTGVYYQRFVEFAIGKTTKSEYFEKFSLNTNRNYQIASFISKSAKPNDRVFVWDNDSPTIYALSKHLPPFKYVADYHVEDFWDKKEMIKSLNVTLPKFIVLSDKKPLPEITPLLKLRYLMILKIENAEIWSRQDLITK